MTINEVSRRYARAFFSVATEKKKEDLFLEELRVLAGVLKDHKEVSEFLTSPTTTVEAKAKAITAALGEKAQKETLNLVLLMVEKGRLSFLPEVVASFEEEIDHSREVTRGVVRSAASLEADQMKSLEQTAKKLTGKQVIFKYELDQKLVGGLVAQVQGWSFDDSLTSHLTSLKEELKNRY